MPRHAADPEGGDAREGRTSLLPVEERVCVSYLWEQEGGVLRALLGLEREHLDALLDDVVAVLVVHALEHVALELGHQREQPLHADHLKRLLHHAATIHLHHTQSSGEESRGQNLWLVVVVACGLGCLCVCGGGGGTCSASCTAWPVRMEAMTSRCSVVPCSSTFWMT